MKLATAAFLLAVVAVFAALLYWRATCAGTYAIVSAIPNVPALKVCR